MKLGAAGLVLCAVLGARENVVYSTVGGVDLKLDAYPAPPGEPAPAVVYIHGGGWMGGSKEKAAYLLQPYRQMGWAAFNVEYRLGGVAPAPAAADDCRAALEWVFAHAREYNVDPRRIVVTGHSAGGHLSLTSAMLADGAFDSNCSGPPCSGPPVSRPAAVVNWYGPADMEEMLAGEHGYRGAARWFKGVVDPQRLARAISPLHLVSARTPPVITIHGDGDAIVPYRQSVRLHEALTKAGVYNRLVSVPGGKHGLDAAAMREAFVAIRAFLTEAGVTGAAAGVAANWPQWRGPESSGVSRTAHDLPVRWSQTENVRWRVKLPSWSAATPAVWDRTVFVVSAEEGFTPLDRSVHKQSDRPAPHKIFLIAVNRADGSIRWRKEIDSGNQIFRKQNSASPSPITDGRHVWVMTGNGRLACLTMDGDRVWERNIQEDYGAFGLTHGYASSPVMHGERLYVQVVHGNRTRDPSYVFAVERATGKSVWKVERPTDARRESVDAYTTPQIVLVEGKPQLVVTGADYATGHDMQTGQELWRMGGFNPTGHTAARMISSSLVMGGNVYTISARGRPAIAYRAGGSGNITGMNELWTNNLGGDVPTPATDGTYIYVLSDIGILHCVEAATGKTMYQGKRIEHGTYAASPLVADGKLYCINEDGTATVLKAGPEFEVLAVNKLDGHTLASPVAAGDHIFVRTADFLYCIATSR